MARRMDGAGQRLLRGVTSTNDSAATIWSMDPPGNRILDRPDHSRSATKEHDSTAGTGAALLLGAVTSAACRICGRRPHPPRMRHTLAKLAAVLPAEFVLPALVLHFHFSYLATVLALVLGTTILVICVAEPSTMRLLRTWLHAPHEKRERHVDASLALWRMRVTVEDEPGSLEGITHALAQLEANILSLKVHPLEEGALDEIVVATDLEVHPSQLAESLAAAGGRDIDVEATSPLALVDIETRALDLAGRVAGNPAELPQAVATLLDAVLVTDRKRIEANSSPATNAHTTTLRLPSPWTAPLLFNRPGRPFTPAESARAHRLAIIAEMASAAR